MDPRVKKLISNKPLFWTEHAKFKMRQYGFSEARVKRVLRNPTRVEVGIAPKTVAAMTPAQIFSTKKFQSGKARGKGQELWVMYEDTKKARKIIAAWRYPGVSPMREPPPFPDDLMLGFNSLRTALPFFVLI
ncbi:MAG: hypothetical protein UX17_C0022G0007 [Parcubacteria group bacterium GW2011_GWC2_45_7]|nr:MAG: hypothetical protein UX17_C0022G0007 [Parcubacteria group bacterium GW2011_GWC2_45_7]KKU73509.1 MAG: hypothetical protein UX98_C0006G0007 [Parcubacteria group bacterium GW2011_GWA2_47_26]